MADAPGIARADVLNCLFELLTWASSSAPTAEEQRGIATVVAAVRRVAEKQATLQSAQAALALTEDLGRIYKRVTEGTDRKGGAGGRHMPSISEQVAAAMHDWALLSGASTTDRALEQRQLEQLELDAGEIRVRGGPKNAAAAMVEFVVGVPARTTFHRRQRGMIPSIVHDDQEREAAHHREVRTARVATALEASTGLTSDEALSVARKVEPMVTILRKQR